MTTTNTTANTTTAATATADKAKKVTTPKASKKSIAAASKGIAAEVNAAFKAVKSERKTISATLVHLANSDTEEAAEIRAFLGLPKAANKAARKTVTAWLQPRYVNVCRNVYVHTDEETDAVIVEIGNVTPCTSKGKPYADMLDAVRDVMKAYKVAISKRREVARQMWSARAAMREKGMYDDAHKAAILAYVSLAPAKLQAQKIHGDFRIAR